MEKASERLIINWEQLRRICEAAGTNPERAKDQYELFQMTLHRVESAFVSAFSDLDAHSAQRIRRVIQSARSVDKIMWHSEAARLAALLRVSPTAPEKPDTSGLEFMDASSSSLPHEQYDWDAQTGFLDLEAGKHVQDDDLDELDDLDRAIERERKASMSPVTPLKRRSSESLGSIRTAADKNQSRRRKQRLLIVAPLLVLLLVGVILAIVLTPSGSEGEEQPDVSASDDKSEDSRIARESEERAVKAKITLAPIPYERFYAAPPEQASGAQIMSVIEWLDRRYSRKPSGAVELERTLSVLISDDAYWLKHENAGTVQALANNCAIELNLSRYSRNDDLLPSEVAASKGGGGIGLAALYGYLAERLGIPAPRYIATAGHYAPILETEAAFMQPALPDGPRTWISARDFLIRLTAALLARESDSGSVHIDPLLKVLERIDPGGANLKASATALLPKIAARNVLGTEDAMVKRLAGYAVFEQLDHPSKTVLASRWPDLVEMKSLWDFANEFTALKTEAGESLLEVALRRVLDSSEQQLIPNEGEAAALLETAYRVNPARSVQLIELARLYECSAELSQGLFQAGERLPTICTEYARSQLSDGDRAGALATLSSGLMAEANLLREDAYNEMLRYALILAAQQRDKEGLRFLLQQLNPKAREDADTLVLAAHCASSLDLTREAAMLFGLATKRFPDYPGLDRGAREFVALGN